jgi:hypothetical protein
MIQYTTQLQDFWSEDLQAFSFTNSYSLGQSRDYHHENLRGEVSQVWQNFEDELPACWKNFVSAMRLDWATVSWTKVPPGRLVPIHQDLFVGLRTRVSANIDQCVRYMVMLNDWHFGQSVEFDNIVIRKWRRGDVWQFDSREFHWAANASNHDFVTCQISTVVGA